MPDFRTSVDLPDADLIRRVQRGDVRAFDVLHDRHRRPVFALAKRITRSTRLAEEATQDAFLNLWRSAQSFDVTRGSLQTWLLALVRNRSIDSLRREGRHTATLQFDLAPAERLEALERTDEQVIDLDEARRTRHLVLGLPPEQRKVIGLTYFGGLSQTEVARQVGVPLGTVKGRQRLGLAKLQREMLMAGSAAPGGSAAA